MSNDDKVRSNKNHHGISFPTTTTTTTIKITIKAISRCKLRHRKSDRGIQNEVTRLERARNVAIY